MKRITIESDGAAIHAGWVALNEKVGRTMRPRRHKPIIAWILGEGPRPAHVPDPHARSERETEQAA